MKQTLHIFHHTDLDGMGVKILGILYAKLNGMNYKTYCCGYSRINKEIKRCLEEDSPSSILIGDISVDQETAKLLDSAYKHGVNLKLYDHHEPAKFLNQYAWAVVADRLDGKPCCGTKLLSEDSRFSRLKRHLAYFIETVNDWDTWQWKTKKNKAAKNLNSLFSVLGENEFTDYILDLVYNPTIEEPSGYYLNYLYGEDSLFTPKTRVMIETQQRIFENQVKSCEKYMYTMNLWVRIPLRGENSRAIFKTVCFKTGVLFINDNLSEMGDRMLEENPDLDIMMMVTFPGGISWRTVKKLPISLSKIAKMATGSGGGHSQASGSSIPFGTFQDFFCRFMDSSFSKSLEYSNFTPAYSRKQEE